MDEFERFQEVVKNYAEAYKAFEDMQRNKISFVPVKGDQKTGVIGEAYIFKYLIEQGYKEVEFGDPSQKAWDIKYKENNQDMKTIQVKTVSDFSDKKIISHIQPGFDVLYLVRLNKNLYPEKILKVTTKGDWPDIKHKAFPRNDFYYRNQKFQTIDETEMFMKVMKMKIN